MMRPFFSIKRRIDSFRIAVLIACAGLFSGYAAKTLLVETFTATNIVATSSVTAGHVLNIVGANEVFYSHPGGSVNDLNPWGGGAVTSWVEVDLNASTTPIATITGIDGSRSKNGDMLWLWNGGGCTTSPTQPCFLNLPNQSTSSAANNRFWISGGKTVSIPNNEGILLIYVGNSWTAFGSSESSVRPQEFNFEGLAKPTALTAGSTTNNYSPWTVSSVPMSSYVFLSATGTGTATITGITAPGPLNTDGRIVILVNTSTTTSIALTNQDAGSSAGNKFTTYNGGTAYIGPRRSAILQYDFSNGTTGSWRMLGGTFDLTSQSTAAPTVSACGTGPTITGNGPSGTVTIGTGVTGCTIAFNQTLTGTPSCLLSYRSHTATADYAVTTTTLTLTNATASATYDFNCSGH